jgi:NAD(P)H-dependent FMN reductase
MPFGRINQLQINMKKISLLASSSKDSINKQLATYAGQFKNAVEVLDLNDYEMPIFSTDKEAATGFNISH